MSEGIVADGYYIFDNDHTALWQGLKGEGVISGGVVTPGTGMNVDISACECRPDMDGTLVSASAETNYGTFTADATNPRKAIIVIGTNGTYDVILGTAAAASPASTGPSTLAPVPPNIPDDHIIIAEVWIPATETDMDNCTITDRRVIVRRNYLRENDIANLPTYPLLPAAGGSWANLTCDSTTYTDIGVPFFIPFALIQVEDCKCYGLIQAKLAQATSTYKTYLQLYNVTDSEAVAGSEVEITSAGAAVDVTSSIFDLSALDNTKQFKWQLKKNTSGSTATAYIVATYFMIIVKSTT